MTSAAELQAGRRGQAAEQDAINHAVPARPAGEQHTRTPAVDSSNLLFIPLYREPQNKGKMRAAMVRTMLLLLDADALLLLVLTSLSPAGGRGARGGASGGAMRVGFGLPHPRAHGRYAPAAAAVAPAAASLLVCCSSQMLTPLLLLIVVLSFIFPVHSRIIGRHECMPLRPHCPPPFFLLSYC